MWREQVVRNAEHLLFHPFGVGDAAAVKRSPASGEAGSAKAIAPVGSAPAVALHDAMYCNFVRSIRPSYAGNGAGVPIGSRKWAMCWTCSKPSRRAA